MADVEAKPARRGRVRFPLRRPSNGPTRSMFKPVAKSIRIIATPPGQAPLWVREKWVGLELPLACYPRPVRALTSGVLDGAPTFPGFLGRLFRGRVSVTKGFAVDAAQAIAVLETKHPDAANWWRANTSLGTNAACYSKRKHARCFDLGCVRLPAQSVLRFQLFFFVAVCWVIADCAIISVRKEFP